MVDKASDVRVDDELIERIGNMLGHLSEVQPTDERLDLIVYLKEYEIVPSEDIVNLYTSWPPAIRTYVNDQLRDFAADQAKNPEMAKADYVVIARLLYSTGCAEDQLDDVEFEKAMRSIAQKLRHYYGQQEGEDEYPCWSRRI